MNGRSMLERFKSVSCKRSICFFAALHLRGARAGGEAGHEVLQLRDLLLALGVLLLDFAAHLALGDDHVVVAAGVGDDGFVVDVGDVRADLVQEVAIVRDGDEHAVVVAQELLEPADAVDVEIVRRLVEQERVGIAEQRLGQEHAQLQAAGQLAHLLFVLALGNAEAGEQLGRVGLRGVAVLFGDHAFELAEQLALLVGERLFGEQLLLLLHRGPQLVVAHQHDREHDHLLEAELVLLQHARALRLVHVAGVRLELAGDDLQEGRLAGAVRAGQAVALAFGELDRYLLEQALFAVGFADVVDIDRGHWRAPLVAAFRRTGARGRQLREILSEDQ